MKRGSINSTETPKSSSERRNCNSQKEAPNAMKPPACRRNKLPHEQTYGAAITIMAILSKGGLPISVFEPLSDVQIAAEESRYAKQFLNKMPSLESPMERMSLLCGFIVSSYSGMVGRRRKPFNPLLGETYDYISEDGWRYNAEQVSHHPAITAFHTEGPDWQLFQALQGNVTIGLSSGSFTPIWPVRLQFDNGDEYSWNKVTTTIQNVRAEAKDRRLLNEGETIIKSNTGLQAKLVFYGNNDNTVTGEVIRMEDSTVLCKFVGSWDKGLDRVLSGNEVLTIFKPIPLSKHASEYYGFSDFSMALNEIHKHEHPYLPVTDSRYRPDKRHLENGEVKLTEQVKKKLEQGQRKRSTASYKPLWFQKEVDAFTGESLWISNKKYWNSKEAQFKDEHSRQMIQLFEKKL